MDAIWHEQIYRRYTYQESSGSTGSDGLQSPVQHERYTSEGNRLSKSEEQPPHPSIADTSLHHQTDVLQSLVFRLKTLEELYEEELMLDAGEVYELPRRVWGKWKVQCCCVHMRYVIIDLSMKFGAHLCDYLTRGESKADAQHNIQELMHFSLTEV